MIPDEPKSTRLLFDEGNAEFLLDALSVLPRADEKCSPIILDFGQQTVLRAQSGDSQTKVLLAGSQVNGPSRRFCLDSSFSCVHCGWASEPLICTPLSNR